MPKVKKSLDEVVAGDADKSAEAPEVKGGSVSKGDAVVIDKSGAIVRIYSPFQSNSDGTYIEKAQMFAKKKGYTIREG